MRRSPARSNAQPSHTISMGQPPLELLWPLSVVCCGFEDGARSMLINVIVDCRLLRTRLVPC
jgi:hypothetical protein